MFTTMCLKGLNVEFPNKILQILRDRAQGGAFHEPISLLFFNVKLL